jgi:MOSC domain-containing protein
MVEEPLGVVAELWRYPVKSMLGERVGELAITASGGLGDRAWALRDLANGRVASAKKYPRLLEFRARYSVEPPLDMPGQVEITTPDGRVVSVDDPDASAIISAALGHPVRLENIPGAQERSGFERATVFGDVPVGQMKPEWTSETMPDSFKLLKGTFFEAGAILVLASGSVEHLRTLQGGTAKINRRRFRPNIYIESAPEWDGRFVEDGWLGGALALGGTVTLEKLQPTVWCVTSTLAQEDLPRDLSVLRTAATYHRGCVGVYATVTTRGMLRIGDAVQQQTPAPSTAAAGS